MGIRYCITKVPVIYLLEFVPYIVHVLICYGSHSIGENGEIMKLTNCLIEFRNCKYFRSELFSDKLLITPKAYVLATKIL